MLSRLTNRLRHTSNDRGSIIIAMIVAVVVILGLVATLTAVYGALNSSRTDQNRINAFQHANAGVDQALYRLDSADMPGAASGDYVPVLSNGKVVGFNDRIAVGGSSFDVVVEQAPAGQTAVYKVRSTGRDPSGRERLVIADLRATSLFENGFFTHELFYLTGNQTSPVAYSSSTCPSAAASCQLPLPVVGRLATNETIDGASATFDHFIASWEGFNMYGRATQAAADEACGQGRCGTTPKVVAITNRLETAYPPEPSPSDGCPTGGVIGVPNLSTTIQPGNYICNNLELRGTIVVGSGGNGSGIVKFWIRGTLTIGGGGIINRGQVPAKMQFFQKDSDPGGGDVCDAEVWSLMYTPGLRVDCNGSHQPEFFGAVVARFHKSTGNHFEFHWDIDSRNAVHDGKYVVRNWRECPLGSTDC
jgi:type II secretory pathway pseudopilin PulG